MRAPISMGKEKSIPVFAMIVLLIAIGSSLYVHAIQIETNIDSDALTIKVNNHDYILENLFSNVEKRTIEIDEGPKSGIALDSLIIYANVECPSCHDYIIKAKDSYQQTVTWEMMQEGILTDSARVYFPDVAHAFWIYDVRVIEVI